MQRLHASVVTDSCYNCCAHPSGSVVHSYLLSYWPQKLGNIPTHRSNTGSEYSRYSTVFIRWQHESFTPTIAVDFGLLLQFLVKSLHQLSYVIVANLTLVHSILLPVLNLVC